MKRITVKDIASDLNIAQSTVSKALDMKSRGVSKEMREQVLFAAARLGYKANRSAQALARNPIKIGIIIPSVSPTYYDLIEQGMKEALLPLQDHNFTAEFKKFSSHKCEDELKQILGYYVEKKVNAVILCPAYNTSICSYLSILHENNIKLIFVGTDLPNNERLTCVRVDGYKAGRMAARFVSLIVHENKRIAMFIGNKDMQEHNEKYLGFRDEISKTDCLLEGVYETQDEPEIAYHLTKKIIKEVPDLGAIYVATGTSIAVCKCLIDHGLATKIKVVATDVFPEIKEYVDQGIIQGVIFQDPRKMGEKSIRILYENLIEGKLVEERNYIKPQLILQSNIEDYL